MSQSDVVNQEIQPDLFPQSDCEMGPTRNPMIWLYGADAFERRCSGCDSLCFDRGRCFCTRRPRFTRHHGSMPACALFRARNIQALARGGATR